VIERNWYEIGAYDLRGGCCAHCGVTIAGRFGEGPGAWGRRRLPVAISQFASGPRAIDPIPPGNLTMKPTSESSTTASRAAAVSPPAPPSIGPEHQAPVLAAAGEFVASAIQGRAPKLADPALAGAAGSPVIGAYVTLKRQGHLRACCGFLGQPRPLIEAVRHASVVTATEDHRLPPISSGELPFLDLHVNLLHSLRRLDARGRERVEAVEVGRHGLRIQRGEAAGLLLPTVPVENGWDSESFLRHVCRKAGLPTTAWEEDDVHLWTFESVEFGGPLSSDDPGAAGPILAPAELQRLAEHACQTVLALARGMAPNYYAYGLADGNVTGLALTIDAGQGGEPLQVVQIALRPGVPLQATLFRLCESAAQAVRASNHSPDAIRVGVTVLADPALHGTLHAPDLRGLDPSRRALLVLDQGQSAWAYSPGRSPEQLLEVVRGQVDGFQPEAASLISLAAQSTEPEVVFHSTPAPVNDDRARPPAVAGRFYPAPPGELSTLVDGLLAAAERRPERWPAAMVPHAGLVYSGGVAASVFNRLEIPETVIIIGPKHTRLGVGWAVAPNNAWSIPGASLAGDPALARTLAKAIPGLRLDAAAHLQEHAIEVELPFLARLAPATKVVGIALGGGDWERCRQFAEGLASVLRGLPSRPLLVISSDMNHFASDREGRRLDEIALRAMEQLDPAALLKTVTEHNISMCGVVPAVIVMETLRQLGGLETCERVGYATSAEVSGDFDRVVGYAGILLR
jgi:AmmeMemoRadiSam system protein B/AmmeMemoRadiSam system protein A